MKKTTNLKKNKYKVNKQISFCKQGESSPFSLEKRSNKSAEFLFSKEKTAESPPINLNSFPLFLQIEKKEGFASAIQGKDQVEIQRPGEKIEGDPLASTFVKTDRRKNPSCGVFSLEKTPQETSSSFNTNPVVVFSPGGKQDKRQPPLSQKKRRVSSQLLQFLKSSSHFGRKSRQLDFAFPWHASMCSQFSGVRNKVAHISGQQTLQSLLEAFYCIALVLRKGGKVLIVNKNSEFSPLFYTKSPDAKNVVFSQRKKQDKRLPPVRDKRLPLVSHKKTPLVRDQSPFPVLDWKSKSRPATAPLSWVGGCLTNWKEISKSVATLLYFSKRFGKFIKQNNIHFPRFKKMKNSFQGFIDIEGGQLLLKEKPGVLFLFNAYESQQILQEAMALQIPVVALTDSSTDLSQITYPIPINSDSIELVHRCLSQLMQITDRQGSFFK